MIVFVGPEKTGTSWIYEALKFSNAVIPLKRKEIFYFDRNYDGDINSHKKWFGHVHDNLLCEVSPSYFKCRLSALRIKDMYPSSKIFVTVREPVSRTKSMHKHLLRNGWTKTISIKKSCLENDQLIPGSLYADNLKFWVDSFGADNVYVVRQEYIRNNPHEFLSELSSISGISFNADVENVLNARVNEASAPRSFILSYIFRKVSYFLRSLSMDGVINLAKKMGVKNLFFTKTRELVEYSQSDEEFLKTTLYSSSILYKFVPMDKVSSYREITDKMRV